MAMVWLSGPPVTAVHHDVWSNVGNRGAGVCCLRFVPLNFEWHSGTAIGLNREDAFLEE